MVRKKKDDEITEEIPVVDTDDDVVLTEGIALGRQVPVKKVDLEVIVDEVLRGEWGVGQDRRLRLSMAGHDPNAVQREIVRRANAK